jgi:alkylation response protein AidB-like acyl-CoA dehydrogenase
MHLSHLLTDEQKALRDTIRKFTDKEIIPKREQLEQDRAAVEQVLGKLVDMGVQRSGFPEEYGGDGGVSNVTLTILCEELARGDAGVSLSAGINCGMILQPAMLAGNKIVLDRFAPAFCGDQVNYACLSMTDSTGGADTENPLLEGRGIQARAKLDGDEWVIDGNKSWPTHAGIASVYLTVATTDPSLGDEGVALIYVPADAPGLSFGKPERKMGYKTSVNASVFYDGVRVPKEYRVAGPGKDAHFYHAIASGAQWHNATQSLGIAQAAFDIALQYTGTRMSNGKPVREWSLAAGIVADMAIKLEIMRGAIYNLATMMDEHEAYPPLFSKEMVAKASIVRSFAADASVWICNKAMELLGSNGLSPEYGLEKCLRDAKATQLVLGGQQIAKYRVANGYYDYTV